MPLFVFNSSKPKPTSSRSPQFQPIPNPAVSPTSSTILTEVLRNNPFGTTAGVKYVTMNRTCGQQNHDQPLQELNHFLEILAALFPDIKAEVFRELLQRFDGESRLQVVVEQLLRHKAEWVKGRWMVPPLPVKYGKPSEEDEQATLALIPLEQRFRTDAYRAATRTALRKELQDLSKSVIEAVLAECNYSYTQARPILLRLEKRSWRAAFGRMLPWRRKKATTAEGLEGHYMIIWIDGDSGPIPTLRETGNTELQKELHDTLMQPFFDQKRKILEEGDREIAKDLAEREATEAEAMYECECCYSDVPFEFISTCSSNTHIICFNCIHHTIEEALFGQGWGRSIDSEKGTLKCLAPTVDHVCLGTLPRFLIQRAVLESSSSGVELWSKFEDRLTSEALLKSQLPLIHCPFCSYAEVDPALHPFQLSWHFKPQSSLLSILFLFGLLNMTPFLLIFLLVTAAISLFSTVPWLTSNKRKSFGGSLLPSLTVSLTNRIQKCRPSLFVCRSPRCARFSCLNCSKSWHDPHICREPLVVSLRTTIEAARTAALTRTCPRCHLSFVKSDGCNKLTCLCGYSMCYLCRKALGPRSDGEGGEGEGYKHFCEHFRPTGGRCTQCGKCDLYKAEDEEDVVRRAGERAERDWRIREGMVGVEGLGSARELETSERGVLKRFSEFAQGWTMQDALDKFVEWMVEVSP